jgi:excisionase family DNA binding protein
MMTYTGKSGEPLAIRPREACRMLSIGLTRLYELLNEGELDSFLVGRSRRVTVASIYTYIHLRSEGTACPHRTTSTRSAETPAKDAVLLRFAEATASIGAVVENVSDSVMAAIAKELRTYGIDECETAELREAICAIVSKGIAGATIRRINVT